MAERLDRRGFPRLGGIATLAAAGLGAGCSNGSEGSKAASNDSSPARTRTLRIVQWSHFVPAYDAWFDGEYIKRWGEDHNVEVVVDHVPLVELPGRADTEVATQRGHDIFGFTIPPPAYEDEVIDHREVVEEVVEPILDKWRELGKV
jgi:ABC-type glycerol-3-phosphate transport system substrate-binding protein